ncbi:MAG TPA: TolC family protein [Treponema sp.]|nr:TolC family protein [Treponema sp.]
MKKHSITVAAGVLLCMAVSVYSEEKTQSQMPEPQVTTLTVEQAVEYADSNSRTLKSAQIDLEMKRRAALYSWNVLVPSVTASGTMSRANQYSTVYAELLNPLYAAVTGGTVQLPTDYSSEGDRWSAVGSLGVSLNLSLAYIDSIRATRAAYEAGKLTWDQTKKQTELNIRKLFYGLLLQQESLKVQETSLENARQRAAQAQINFKNGIVPEISMLQAQVSYENMRPNIDKMEQTVSQQLDTFAFLLGMPVGTKIRLDGKIEPHFVRLNADQLYEQYGSGNPDVLSLRKNIDILKMQLSALNFKSYTPALALGWTTQPVLSDVMYDWGDKDNWYDGGNLHLTVAWTLSDMLWFSANRQQARDLQDNIRKLEISLETVEQNNEMQIRKTVDSLEQSHQAILSSSRNITLAQRSYDMTAVAYRNGTTELLDLRDTENQLNLAKIGLLNEQYNYMSYMLDLEYMLNTALGEGK